jgi:hypothetical protein
MTPGRSKNTSSDTFLTEKKYFRWVSNWRPVPRLWFRYRGHEALAFALPVSASSLRRHERAARVGGTSGRLEWAARVGGASGRHERAARVGGTSGRRGWAARADGASGRRGRTAWADGVGGWRGRTAWADGVGGRLGRTAWADGVGGRRGRSGARRGSLGLHVASGECQCFVAHDVATTPLPQPGTRQRRYHPWYA